ncbi:MAG: acetyl-CoA hydrolase [Oleiphilaceae bacterium]|nr:acetyl-CoA hydrolase [Oleiphilaceae bacterium]
MADSPAAFTDQDACVDAIIERVGKRIVIGLPLGLGKPIRLANALYRRACDDSSVELRILTALSLMAPVGKSSFEKRFLEPFTERLFGDIPELAYAADALSERLPDNVTVSEFFFRAGSALKNQSLQRHYICTNYTHAARDLLVQGVNVVAQMVAPGSEDATGCFSLSCNPDLSLDLMREMRSGGYDREAVAFVAETNRQLPYMGRDAEVKADEFDIVFDDPASDYPLFPVPEGPISPADHLIGFYASALLKDGGTLQVGIGSLGSALVYSAILRHRHNEEWQRLHRDLKVAELFPVTRDCGGTGPFELGLYGCSEMMIDGFVHLMNAGILKREVYDNADLQTLINAGLIGPELSIETLDVLRQYDLIESPLRARDVSWLQQYGILDPALVLRGGRLSLGEKALSPDLDDPDSREQLEAVALGGKLTGGVTLHGGFYLGPDKFYQQLRDLSPEERSRICMTSVNFINHLYDHPFGDQRLKAAQRCHSRFVNSTMMHTLSGAAVSDGFEDGRVLSGVGGQYNFVAMAHELPGARSILTLRSTRTSGGKAVSNIVFNYGHCTIPRQLRDVVVTEYGIADLRGQPDEAVYLALIRIADSRFQQGLLRKAQDSGKVARHFRLPEEWRQNTPEAVKKALKQAGHERFPAFPFGSSFTPEELTLGEALQALKTATATRRGKLVTLVRALGVRTDDPTLQPLLERMSLAHPSDLRERIDQRLLIYGLHQVKPSH